MNVEVNGRPRELDKDTTLTALIESLTGSARGSAAVVDDEVVPRSRWRDYRLRDGQRIELITAVPGG